MRNLEFFKYRMLVLSTTFSSEIMKSDTEKPKSPEVTEELFMRILRTLEKNYRRSDTHFGEGTRLQKVVSKVHNITMRILCSLFNYANKL